MDGHQNPNRSAIIGAFAALAAMCLAIGIGALGLAQGGTTMIEIAKMTPGAPPSDFDFARTGQGPPGQWGVVADTSAHLSRAIEQSNTDRTDYRFPLAIYRPLSARNLDATLRFKAISGRVDQAGGIALRVLDADNYYVVRANALEDNVRFYHVIKGRRTELKGANLKVASNVWHALGLKAEGERFTVSYDGQVLYTVTDRTLNGAGRVALWTKADSVTRFDRIEIKTLP